LHRFGQPILTGDLAKAATREPVEQPRTPAGLLWFQTFNAFHEAPPRATFKNIATGQIVASSVPRMSSWCTNPTRERGPTPANSRARRNVGRESRCLKTLDDSGRR